MHAHRRKAAERRFVLVRAPRRRRQEQRVRIGHAGFDVLDGAELAGLDAVVQLDHLRMEAAVVADADHALGLAHGVERRFGLLLGKGERLLAIDVLAGGGRGLDLLADGRRAASPAPPRRSWDRPARPRSSWRCASECCLAKASTSGVTVRVCKVVKRMRSLPPASDSTIVLPQVPSPTTAALIMLIVLDWPSCVTWATSAWRARRRPASRTRNIRCRRSPRSISW